MGQYLQMGIGYRMEIDKNRLDKLGLTIEKLLNRLNEQMDMSLFNCGETQEKIIFEIKESVVSEQLQEFMEFQYSLYSQEKTYVDCFKLATEMIRELSSLQEIVEVAEEGRFPCFQSNRITDEIKVSAWGWLEIDISMFVFFVEGKIFMEGYNSLLKFIENNVRQSGGKWTIAGAFKCFIN